MEQGSGRDLVLASDRLQVDGDTDRRVLGDDASVVGGAATVEADEIVPRANQRIMLEVGGNRVLLDGSGIAVEAAGGSVTVSGAKDVDISSARRVRIEGTEVEIEAGSNLTARAIGNATVTAALIRLN